MVSLSSFRHDGSKLDEARCRERATGRTTAVGSPPNLDALLLELGYTSEALSDRCIEFVRVKYMTERALEQETYVSCVKQRAVFLSEHPGWSEPYVCSGPNNRRAAFDACLEQREHEIEKAPDQYPEGYVDGCRRLLRWGPAAILDRGFRAVESEVVWVVSRFLPEYSPERITAVQPPICRSGSRS